MLYNHNNKVHDNLILRNKSRREKTRLYRQKKNNLYQSSSLSLETIETIKAQLHIGIFNRIMSRFSTLKIICLI